MSKLMKPLFIDGNFNREGKRMRANYVKTIGDYPLWIADGKPDKDYTRYEDDKYYYYIQVDEWLIMCGYTEHELKERAGYNHLNKEWYGDFQGRNDYLQENIYKGRSYEEYSPLIKELVAKETEAATKWGNDETIQAELLKQDIDKHIETYIDARDNNGTFPDFIGAVFLGELDKCEELAKIRRARVEEERKLRKAEAAKQKAKEEEERKQAEQKLIEETEQVFINGGTIKDGEIILKLANKYNINIPIRTKGWILDCFAESTIKNDGTMSCRYWKRKKNATGSTIIYSILREIRTAIMA
jgi:hypothetical protein